jgi:pre-mRNA-splicing factor 18
MSLAALKAEIEKKRKLAEEVPKPGKYVKRGDIEKELIKKHQEKKQVNSPHQQQPDTPSPIKSPENVNEKATPTEDSGNVTEQVPLLSKNIVIQRLRERGQPITLFGETDWQIYQRLRLLEEREPIEYIQGMDNEFGKAIKEIDKGEGEKRDDDDDDDLLGKIGKSGNSDEASRAALDPTTATCKEDFILLLFKKLLNEWEQELSDRPEGEKRTAQGKVATATYKQCRKHIKPLFKLLKERHLAEDILDPVHEIGQFMLQREYVKANDTYLQMAIGNAPWPMGVTMVGIHERSAREKIFSNQVAHVLNDETQRKYIQSIKRIMTWSQHKYPNAPSKCVG